MEANSLEAMRRTGRWRKRHNAGNWWALMWSVGLTSSAANVAMEILVAVLLVLALALLVLGFVEGADAHAEARLVELDVDVVFWASATSE